MVGGCGGRRLRGGEGVTSYSLHNVSRSRLDLAYFLVIANTWKEVSTYLRHWEYFLIKMGHFIKVFTNIRDSKNVCCYLIVVLKVNNKIINWVINEKCASYVFYVQYTSGAKYMD